MTNPLPVFFEHHFWHLIGAFVILAGSLLAMQRLLGVIWIRRIAIPSVFYLTYLPMILFPAFWVYLDHPGPYRDPYFIGVVSVLVTVPIGIHLANVCTGYSRRETAGYFAARIEEPAPSLQVYLGQLVLVTICLGIFAAYMSVAPRIPLLEWLMNPFDSQDLRLAREESFKLLDPRWNSGSSTYMFYAYLFLRTLMFPLLILTTMGYFLVARTGPWLALFGVTLIVGCFYAASSLARAPISAIVMRLFFFLFLFYAGRLKIRTVVVFLVLMLAFPLAVTTFTYTRDHSLIHGLLSIGRRFTYTPAQDLYYYFEVFPVHHGYLYGHSLVKPILKLFGASYFYIENFVHLYISPYGVPTGHANAAFISNMHADGGFLGVLLGGVLTGALMQAVQIYLTRRRKTVFNIALYSFCVYAVWALNFGSITSVLFVNGLIPVFVLAWGMRQLVAYLGLAVGPGALGVGRRTTGAAN